MKRRDMIAGLGTGALAAGLAGCGADAPSGSTADTRSSKTFNWKMVTTWPPNFPGLGRGATNLAQRIELASGGRIKIRVYAAGELVPPFEVFDAVSQGTAEMGHGGAYYWKAKVEAAQFIATVPFGLNAAEMNGWMYYGDGLSLYQSLYEPFGLIPFPAGNTGAQTGGWFNRRIESTDDLKGLKMRIPGLGGEVLRRAGGTPVSLPGGEIFTSLQTGNIDATEWVGPYNDMALGFHRVAKYYYYPGWHEPGPMLEATINLDAWRALPEDLQEIVRVCCQSINCDMLAEYSFANAGALATLQQDPEVEILRLPDEVLKTLKDHTDEVVEEITARNADAKAIYDSLRAFQVQSTPWQMMSEAATLATREL